MTRLVSSFRFAIEDDLLSISTPERTISKPLDDWWRLAVPERMIVFVVLTEEQNGERSVYAIRKTQADAEHKALEASKVHHRAWWVPEELK